MTPERVEQIREAINQGLAVHVVAKLLGCGYETVARIRDNLTRTVEPYRCGGCGLVTNVSPCQRCAALHAPKTKPANPVEADEDEEEIVKNGLPTREKIALGMQAIREAHLEELRTGKSHPLLEEIKSERDRVRVAGVVRPQSLMACKSA